MSSPSLAASSLKRRVSRSQTSVSSEGTEDKIITLPLDSCNGFTVAQPGSTEVNSGAACPTFTSSPRMVAKFSPILKKSLRTVVICFLHKNLYMRVILLENQGMTNLTCFLVQYG